MARGHTYVRYGDGDTFGKCRRCRKPAHGRINAERLSRSENWRRYCVGRYCDECGPKAVAALRQQASEQERTGQLRS